MTELSPAAQAALSAYHEEAINYTEEWGSFKHKRGLAAVLQAVADQVVPEEIWLGAKETCYAYYLQRCNTRQKLLAIAAELKAHD